MRIGRSACFTAAGVLLRRGTCRPRKVHVAKLTGYSTSAIVHARDVRLSLVQKVFQSGGKISTVSSFEGCVVLVADDEQVVLNLVIRVLTQHGYVVLSAEDGPSALRVCQEHTGPIHLALLDIVMPGMTGPQLFDFLAQVHSNIEVLFMSGYSGEQIAELAPGVKDSNFIGKPFQVTELVKRVNNILNNDDLCTRLDSETTAAHG
jgi:CheY-like chemotaxis protein